MKELTDERIDSLAMQCDMGTTAYENDPMRCWRSFARAIESEVRATECRAQAAGLLGTEEVRDTLNAAYRAAVDARITNGGMAGELWDRIAAEAVQRKFCEVNGLSIKESGDAGE